jgi:hypothetical protein
MIETEKQVTSDDGSRESPSGETTTEQQTIVSELSLEGQLKLEVIQSLLEPCDRVTYGQRLRDGAQKLEISVRSVQRLFKKGSPSPRVISTAYLNNWSGAEII